MARYDGRANLRPPRSSEEARERGRKGGIASGEVRRKKKQYLDIARRVMESDLPDKSRESIEKITGKLDDDEACMFAAMVAAQAKEAMKGDTSAFRALCELMSESGTQQAQEDATPDALSEALRELGESL
jgi:hypothetical protein